jgi:hypothetical protein
MPRSIALLLLIPPLSTGLTPGLVLLVFMAWKNQDFSLINKIYYSAIALAACGFVSILINWNML